MFEDNFVLCKKCILHSKIPNVMIGDDGVCNLCHINNENNLDVSKFFIRKAERLFEAVKKEKHTYDILVMFSGGKDSTALLDMVKNKYGLRPLALSIIHPLVGNVAQENMKEVANKLHVDLYKFYVDENLYIDFMRYGLLNAEKYGLGESAGCRLCGFLYHWAGTRIAMEMNIPILVDGADRSQILNNYWSGRILKKHAQAGNLPHGVLHQIFEDAIGERYGHTIYSIDDEMIHKLNFPTQMSPFSFMDYDYREDEERMLNYELKQEKYKKIETVCTAIHFFDYITFKKYSCPSYVRHWANGLRENYPALMQLDSRGYKEVNELSRTQILNLMREYKEALFYIGGKYLDKTQKEEAKEYLMRKCKYSTSYYGKEAYEKLADNILKVDDYARMFRIDLNMFNNQE